MLKNCELDYTVYLLLHSILWQLQGSTYFNEYERTVLTLPGSENIYMDISKQ